MTVRLERVESQLADLTMQAQMADARRARDGGPSPMAPATPDGMQPLEAGGRALARGELAMAQGHYAQALAAAHPASADAAQALMGLGDTAIAQGAHHIAVHHLTRLVALHAAHPRAHEAALKLAMAHEALAAYAEAYRVLQGIVAQHPHSTSAQVARVHLAARARPPR